MGTKNLEIIKPERERGTLNETLPKQPIILISLICIASAALSTALLLYSTPHLLATTNKDVMKLLFIACLGSISTLVGVIFSDSLSHVASFGVALLFLHIDNTNSYILATLPSLLMAILSSTKGPRDIVSSLNTTLLLSPMFVISTCTLPLLLLVHQSIVNPTHLPFSTIPICTVTFLTLLLMYMYNKHKAHKHGCLLTPEMKSQSIFAGIAILLSCCVAVEKNPGTSIIAMTVFLLGSVFTILMSVMFASVADVWYAVGSGQFQMVSLDTVGIMLYFICPAVILYLRFLDKYGDITALKLKTYLESTGIFSSVVGTGDDVISLCLVLSLAMVTVVGVPLLNALCPMGGYLFSRAYTHGQPNTKKVALCVDYADLPKGKDAKLRLGIWEALEKKNAVLNIYVTLEELTLFPVQLKLLADKGHVIQLAPTEFEEEAFNGWSMFQGNKSSCNLQIAHYEYTELFGEEPKWLLSRSVDSIGRHPTLLSEARELGMKVAYWSTLVQLMGDTLTKKQLTAVQGDITDKNGGSIVYIKLGKGISARCLAAPLCEIINKLDDQYSLESLSDVAKDEVKMVLKGE